MAFTFTVEDGSLVSGANSYVAVATADDYYVIDPNFTATWTAYTNDQKQYYLAWATRLLDQKTKWDGKRYTTTQSLRWPRQGVKDRDGNLIAVTTIPLQLQQAVMELAKWLATNDPTTGPDTDALKRVMVDVIEIEWQDGAFQSDYPSLINQLLWPLGRFATGGPSFGRIVRG